MFGRDWVLCIFHTRSRADLRQKRARDWQGKPCPPNRGSRHTLPHVKRLIKTKRPAPECQRVAGRGGSGARPCAHRRPPSHPAPRLDGTGNGSDDDGERDSPCHQKCPGVDLTRASSRRRARRHDRQKLTDGSGCRQRRDSNELENASEPKLRPAPFTPPGSAPATEDPERAAAAHLSPSFPDRAILFADPQTHSLLVPPKFPAPLLRELTV